MNWHDQTANALMASPWSHGKKASRSPGTWLLFAPWLTRTSTLQPGMPARQRNWRLFVKLANILPWRRLASSSLSLLNLWAVGPNEHCGVPVKKSTSRLIPESNNQFFLVPKPARNTFTKIYLQLSFWVEPLWQIQDIKRRGRMKGFGSEPPEAEVLYTRKLTLLPISACPR